MLAYLWARGIDGCDRLSFPGSQEIVPVIRTNRHVATEIEILSSAAAKYALNYIREIPTGIISVHGGDNFATLGHADHNASDNFKLECGRLAANRAVSRVRVVKEYGV